MKEFLSKHRERVTLIGVGVAFLLCVGGGVYLQDKKQKDKETLPDARPQKVELKIPDKSVEGSDKTSSKITSFFLKPSPAEVMEQLASMENLNENVSNAKLNGLRVMWPVYFFELQEQQGQVRPLLLDVSEDGFGLMIKTEIDASAYPEIQKLKSGQKIWVAGEIMAIDPTGTGTIIVQSEHFDFTEDGSIASSFLASDAKGAATKEEVVQE